MTSAATRTARDRTRARLLGVAAGVAILSLSSAVAQAGGSGRIVSAGPLGDYSTATAGPYDDAWGRATLSERRGGSTITFKVSGIDRAVRGVSYGAHLHLGPCVTDAPLDAKGHYNTDVIAGRTPPRIDRTTEVWLDFTVSKRGTGEAVARVPFVPEPGARSIVVHAEETHPDGTAGARLACLPLVWMP